jgi:hypothetical protein
MEANRTQESLISTSNKAGPENRSTLSSKRLAYSINEVVSVSGLSRSLLYLEISAGRLVAHKAGRRTVILTSDLETWLSALPRS